MPKTTPRLYIVSYFSWLRESEQTLYERRMGMIHFVDNLLNTIQLYPDRERYVLDGQTILLDDYLAVRPSQQERVQRAVQDNMLQIGPWYITPHQFLASPEALIRNLLIGRECANHYGRPLSVCFMPGLREHIRQLPQILRSFGIDSAVVTTELLGQSIEHNWIAPDGSRVLLVNVQPRRALIFTDEVTTLAQLKSQLTRIGKTSGTHNLWPQLVLLASGSFEYSDGDTFNILGNVAEKRKPIQFEFGDIIKYVRLVAEQAGEELPVITGDLGEILVPGSLSNRILVKLRNHDAQTLLESWVEPFGAWAYALNATVSERRALPSDLQYPESYADMVKHLWQVLLQNHNYATLGCYSVDQVYHEALVRFQQVEQAATTLISNSLNNLATRVSTNFAPSTGDSFALVVFNPSGISRTDIASIRMHVPTWDNKLAVADAEGRLYPYEIQQVDVEGDVHELHFVASEVPPFGYRTFIVKPSASDAFEQIKGDEGYEIENKFMTVSFDPLVGTLTVFDKRTGRSFKGLNHFVNGGDSGSLHDYQPPERDTRIDIAANTPIFVERKVSGVVQSLTYLQIYRLPRQLTPQRDSRLPLAAQFVPLSIVSHISLVQGVPRVDVETVISNSALDHRLTVRFPLGFDAQRLMVDGHFHIADRSELLTPVLEYGNESIAAIAQRTFLTVCGSDTSLTISSRGLPEAAIITNQEGTQIELTLIRATGRLKTTGESGEDGNAKYLATPDAQCLGEYKFRYSIVPHDLELIDAWNQARASQSSLKTIQTDIHQADMPPDGGMLSIDNHEFVVTAIKIGEDGHCIVVRGYNISTDSIRVNLRPNFNFVHVERVLLDETPSGVHIESDADGIYNLDVRPAEIVTLRFNLRTPQS